MELKPTTIKKPFDSVVGQDNIKSTLNFYIEGFRETSMIPHFLFVAEKGCGKTMMATEVAKHLKLGDKPKRAREINCATLKGVGQFVEQVVIPFVHNSDCTIVFDEASELPKDLTMSLLTMLNPNAENRNIFRFQDLEFEVNFKRHSFMFCTTEPQKIFHALMSRCKRIDFEPYRGADLMKIVEKNVFRNSDTIFANDGVQSEIPTVLRGNPRCAQMMATDIVTYSKRFKTTKFGMTEWKSLKKHLSIMPLGLNATEIKVLQILEKTTECRLSDIAAKLGMTPSAVQRDAELFLLRSNLMQVRNGRCLTGDGKQFLENLRKEIK